MNTMTMLLMIVSLMFLFSKHPLTMAIIVILHTLMIAMITGMILSSFWFSYIVLIIMLSGMLVLFIYMASIASNEKFYPSVKLSIIIMTAMMIITMMPMYSNTEFNKINYNNSMSIMWNNLFNTNMNLTIIMVMYLFFSMMTVSKIVNIQEGPLRMKK
uniref:NADH dehydrogenase subunit 6 n=1 Tax=Chauliops zhengi TaxID=2936724 RepID=UPI0030FE1485